jgi:hypothetical protein
MASCCSGSGSGSVCRPLKAVFKKNLVKILPLHPKLSYKEKIDKFHQIYCKM